MEMTWNTELARTRMDALRMSYADIARYLGYERQTVGHWFRGRGNPSVQDLKKMATLLNLDVAELISPDAVIANNEAERETVKTMRQLTSQESEMVRWFAKSLKDKRGA